MFRKAKGLGEQGYFEKASKILEDIKTKNPSGSLFQDQMASSFTYPSIINI